MYLCFNSFCNYFIISANNPYKKEIKILNDKFKYVTEYVEYRMSHGVEAFGIDDRDKNIVLPINYTFHLDSFEEIESGLIVKFMIYPIRSNVYEAEINLDDRIFIHQGQTRSLSEFKEYFVAISESN